MFSSNQILEVSGSLSHAGELTVALEFALKLSNQIELFKRKDNPAKCVYQITADGRYCIGWAFENAKDGWREYPFDFDIEIIARIIAQHLEKQEIERDVWDGGYYKGFLMKVIDECMSAEDNGVKNPFYGIVEFRPYTCFYSK